VDFLAEGPDLSTVRIGTALDLPFNHLEMIKIVAKDLTELQTPPRPGFRAGCAEILAIIVVFMMSSVVAQQPVSTPRPSVEKFPIDLKKDEVLRVDTNLIEVDAIVKDKNGNLVRNLSKADFEIIENGQIKPVDYSSFVSVTESRDLLVSAPDKRLLPNEVRRSIVFISNNPLVEMGYAFPGATGTYSMRDRSLTASQITSKFLSSFIDEQMGPRDLISIVDTEVNLGVLSSFTNDRETLRATVRQMRSNIGKYPIAMLRATQAGLDIDQLVQQNLAVLDTAQTAVEQLNTLPGRKIVVMISRALLYNTALPGTQVVKERIETLIAEANQAQVTFYFVSPIGLGDDKNGFDRISEGGVQKLGYETGGRSILRTNDASSAFKEILDENEGYYQLAYDPGDVEARPRNITVRVRKAGLSVQTRSTVYKAASSIEVDPKENLLRLLRAPFGSNDLEITMLPIYQALGKNKGRIKTSLKIDTQAIEAVPAQTDNFRHLRIDIGLQVKGPNNILIRQEIKNISLKISPDSWSQILREGLIYRFDTDTEQRGYHQVNVAACVPAVGVCGSASHFVNSLRAGANNLPERTTY
jgi:VWFA-related protein